eukprot:TRINITY_DN1713_c0_g1_i1.p1 TRINITY_DN1713_c0_g1~~TRINITY_DN1713_c0_g1_i1.p1  ORF type:complete len:1151 (+),score=297.03 TRINITY_DN1713_c0_g1_i1:53-3505(+)
MDATQLLELFKSIVATVQNEPTVDSWNELRVFAEEDLRPNSEFHPPANLVSSVLNLLINKAGKKDGKIKWKMSDESIIALECLYHLLIKVDEFQDAIEAVTTTQLTKLRLGFVILEGDKDSKMVAMQLILFLQENILKFKDLSLYVHKSAKVQKYIDEHRHEANVPEMPRLSSIDRLSVQAEYYDIDVKVVVRGFQSDMKKGLTSTEVANRTAIYGLNVLPQPEPRRWWSMLFEQVKDFMMIILFLAAVASYAIGDPKAGSTLLFVILINVIIGFVQEYKAEKAINALMSMDVQKAKVIRDGNQVAVEASSLVPGDIVVLDEGDQIPADLRLFEVSNLKVIEAVLTGESEPIEKTTKPIRSKNPPVGDRKNMAMMTTTVVGGRGKGIVSTIGVRTEAGKIAESLVKSTQPPTPLQKRLDFLGKVLVVIALALVMMIVGIGFIRDEEVVDLVKLSVSLGVSAIPEGLVAVTTVVMAIGVQRMAKKNGIIRKLSAVETLGSVSVICSDKTGTLTEGKMKATQLWTGNNLFSFEGHPVEGQGLSRVSLNDETVALPDPRLFHLERSLQICALCNNSSYTKDVDKVSYVGDPTEVACMIGAMTGGIVKSKLADDGGDWTFVLEHAFDSTRKRMSVVYEYSEDTNLSVAPSKEKGKAKKGKEKGKEKDDEGTKERKTYVLAKGGCESILSICKHQNLKEKKPLTDKYKAKIEKKAAELAENGLRVLALAYKAVPNKKGGKKLSKKVAEKDLTFIGLIGIIDPERKEVKGAIARCHQAGITVCMITGDHQSTAKAIAIKLNIADKSSKPLRGTDIDVLFNTGTLNSLDPWPTVFARVSPENKLQLVQALQSRGSVVAMTGDGVNDAPAIKSADCGVAMGISGTDITKQVASVVLRDDNFETIANAVEEGRVIYDNIQKFIIYILACNSAEVFSVLGAIAIFGSPIPFTVMQVLWANIVCDIPTAMALGVDPAEKDVMTRPPRDPKESILNLGVGILLLCQSLIMSILCVASLRMGLTLTDIFQDPDTGAPYTTVHAQTLCFVVLCTCQLFHGMNCRSLKLSLIQINPISNLWMVAAIFGSFGLVVGSLYVPGVNTFLQLTPLIGVDWAVIGISLVIFTVLVEIMKAIYRLVSGKDPVYTHYEPEVAEELVSPTPRS